jgi:hypothetical protein
VLGSLAKPIATKKTYHWQAILAVVDEGDGLKAPFSSRQTLVVVEYPRQRSNAQDG